MTFFWSIKWKFPKNANPFNLQSMNAYGWSDSNPPFFFKTRNLGTWEGIYLCNLLSYLPTLSHPCMGPHRPGLLNLPYHVLSRIGDLTFFLEVPFYSDVKIYTLNWIKMFRTDCSSTSHQDQSPTRGNIIFLYSLFSLCMILVPQVHSKGFQMADLVI